MAIVLANQISSSVRTPAAGKISIFYQLDTGNVYGKTSQGNTFPFAGVGQLIFTQVYNASNNTVFNQNFGSVFLNSGSLSISSSAILGTLNGTDTAIVDLYKESTSAVIATWTVVTGQLQNTMLTASAGIAASDWYSVRMRVSSGLDTAMLLGIRFVFE